MILFSHLPLDNAKKHFMAISLPQAEDEVDAPCRFFGLPLTFSHHPLSLATKNCTFGSLGCLGVVNRWQFVAPGRNQHRRTTPPPPPRAPASHRIGKTLVATIHVQWTPLSTMATTTTTMQMTTMTQQWWWQRQQRRQQRRRRWRPATMRHRCHCLSVFDCSVFVCFIVIIDLKTLITIINIYFINS